MLADWYSPSTSSRFLFYAALTSPREAGRSSGRFLTALAVEAAWEVAEKYSGGDRPLPRGDIALGYVGDSIVNNLSDIAMRRPDSSWLGACPLWATLLL